MLLKKTVPWPTSSFASCAKRPASFPSPALIILNFTNPDMLGMKEQPGKMFQEQVKRGGGRRTEVRVMTSPAIPQGPMFHLQGVPQVLQQDIMCSHMAGSMLFPIRYHRFHRFHSQANFRLGCHNPYKLLHLLAGS